MSQRFLKYIVSDKSSWLRKNHPNAYLLLSLIAERARRTSGHIDGLEVGDAHIGDFKMAGIETESKYRTAKNILIRIGAIKNKETCRNRKKLTTDITGKTTTVGTLVTLLNSEFWDINKLSDDDRNDDRNDDRIATGSRPSDDEQERKERKNEKKDVTLEETKNDPSSIVSFSSFLKEESGIVPSEVRVFLDNNHLVLSNTDLEAWCALYEPDRVIGTITLMLSQAKSVTNPGGWLMKAFRENYFQRNRNWEICLRFKRERPLAKIKVLKSYSVNEITREEIPYTLDEDDLVRKLNEMLDQQKRA